MISWIVRRGRTGALRHHTFRGYFYGQSFLLIGNWIHTLALGWLIWRLSHSPFLLGVLAFCNQGPSLLLAPLVGALADRADGRRLLLATQSCQAGVAAVLAVLTITGTITSAMAVVAALALGISSALDSAVRQSFVAELVGREDLRDAIALNSMLFNTARLIGPAVSGLIIAALDEGYCFIIKAAASLPLMVVLWRMRLPPKPRRPALHGLFDDVMGGLRFIADHAAPRYYLALLGIGSFATVPYYSFLPMLASDVLKGGAGAAGLLMSATGIGALSVAFVLLIRTSLPLVNVLIAASATQGIVLALMGLSQHLWLTVLLALPMGGSTMAQQFATSALLHNLVPDAIRGRIMALYTMMLIGTVPIGSVAVGMAIGWIGLPMTSVCFGMACLAITGQLAFLLNRQRKQEPLPH